MMGSHRVFLIAVLVLLSIDHSLAQSGEIARTPPMGWNSWNLFACKVSDAVVRARDYVRRAIEAAPGFGSGHGPLNHWPG